MKRMFYIPLLCVIVLLSGCKSYEERMAEFAKEAEEFKSTLPPNTDVLCIITDSIATKVFYREEDSSSITVYDLETDSKSKIILEDEMYYYGFKARRYNDRLFVIVETGACGSGLGNLHGVFYINVRDNSSHFVTSCEEASFLDNGEIHIRRAFPVDDSGPSYEWEWQRDEYTLSTSLSNEEYSSREKMQEEKEETIAREERNRPKIKKIRISLVHEYGPGGDKLRDIKCEGVSGVQMTGLGEILTDEVTVPYGKKWTINDIRASNMTGYPIINRNGLYWREYHSGDSPVLLGGDNVSFRYGSYLNCTVIVEIIITEERYE